MSSTRHTRTRLFPHLFHLLIPLIAIVQLCFAKDDGLARTPPMGWRSWNLYALNVDQKLMERVMDGFTRRHYLVDGKETSLADLGYTNIGLDDGWQKCQNDSKKLKHTMVESHKFNF